MTARPLISSLGLIALALPIPGHALQIRVYSAGDHDRFTGFPNAPVVNPGFIHGAQDFPGVGWRQSDPIWQYALVSRSHILAAAHASPPVGTEIRFLSQGGQVVSRNVASRSLVKNGDDTDSDLMLIRLNQPIEADEGVPPFPYFDLSHEALYVTRQVIVFGRTARAGSGTYTGFTNVSASNLNKTYTITYDYNLTAGGNNDARLESGDSGSPQFISQNGVPGVVAVNTAIDINGNIQTNFAAFVPNYIANLNAQLAATGYRMTPANTGTTTLTGNSPVPGGTPRKGNPLEITVTLENTGPRSTGNLELEFGFEPGEEPDSITGSGWVDYGGGSEWIVRHPLLAASANSTVTLSWSSAPLVDELDWNVSWRSDKAAGGSLDESLPLGDSFNAWAAGLPLAGPLDDPDLDLLANVIEYAFGCDPESGTNLLPNGEPGLPTVGGDATSVVLTFPERSDSAARGLTYPVQWSDDLEPESWSSSPPAGLVSTTSPYSPDVPGFVKRTLTWPAAGDWQFARVGVLLEE